MGLDMYANKTKHKPEQEVDFNIPEGQEAEELFYWRKHPNLHGWMEDLYRKKGGDAPDFNCVNVLLTLDDLEKLKNDIQGMALPETNGFFFGQSYGTADERKHDLEFVKIAEKAIEDGYTVFYSSWW
jgi:hypothetical protein